jgi:selenocysteine-specific elongation factor
VFCLHGDPFIIRQFSPTITIGGGTILHPNPSKHKSTDKHALAYLQRLNRGGGLSEKIPVFLEISAQKAMDTHEINALLGLPASELMKICTALAQSGKSVMVPAPSPILVLASVVESLSKETVAQVTAFHKENPLQKGISKEELRKRVYDDMPLEIFRFCLEGLVNKHKLALQEDLISLHGREVHLSSEGEQVREMIEVFLQKAGYQPPSASDLQSSISADPEEVRRVFFWMLKERILIKLSDEIVYHRSTIEEIKKQIKARFAAGSKFGVADFKELFDITRKHAIPLLEYLDREKFTRRLGNDRVLL